MSTTTDPRETLARDGWVFFREFFPAELVARAYREVEALYQADMAARTERGVADAHFDGPGGHSVLTAPTHLMIDLYGKSPALDEMFERVLTDPAVAPVLTALAGPGIKLRGYNCTRLTGAHDPGPRRGAAPNPHDWHRDSQGEFGFGLFLSDFAEPNQGTTALMRGSHVFPYCPRWNCLFGEPYHRGLPLFLALNPMSRLLARRVRPLAMGAYGRAGDFYLFLNDTWHGREPNLAGHQGLRIMVGAFPADMPYPDEVRPLTDEVLARLPPALRAAAPQPRPTDVPTAPKPLLEAMWQAQQAPHPALFGLAHAERQVADALSGVARRLRDGLLGRG